MDIQVTAEVFPDPDLSPAKPYFIFSIAGLPGASYSSSKLQQSNLKLC